MQELEGLESALVDTQGKLVSQETTKRQLLVGVLWDSDTDCASIYPDEGRGALPRPPNQGQ